MSSVKEVEINGVWSVIKTKSDSAKEKVIICFNDQAADPI
jgi:hypothetical protein